MGKTIILEQPLELDGEPIVGIIKWRGSSSAYTSKYQFEQRLKHWDVKDHIKFYEDE